MTTKKTETNKKTTHHVHHAAETASALDASTNKEILMSKIAHATPTSHSSHAVAAPAETETVTLAANAASVTPTPAPVPAAPSQVAAQPKPAASKPSSGAPAAGPTATGFLAPPPSPDPLFVAPTGFVPDNAMDFRGVLPRTSELIALPIAVRDLGKFADYAQVMGTKAPSIEQVQQAFDVTNQWSAARTQADAWDQYARTQEGMAWSLLRPMIARIAPAFVLAVGGDPSIAAQYPGLTTLLDAKKTIAQKAVATKKANKKNVAEGKLPTHGKVGKKATKAAEKAALAEKLAAEAAAATPEPATPAAPAAPPTPAPSQPSPVAASLTNGAAAKPS